MALTTNDVTKTGSEEGSSTLTTASAADNVQNAANAVTIAGGDKTYEGDATKYDTLAGETVNKSIADDIGIAGDVKDMLTKDSNTKPTPTPSGGGTTTKSNEELNNTGTSSSSSAIDETAETEYITGTEYGDEYYNLAKEANDAYVQSQLTQLDTDYQLSRDSYKRALEKLPQEYQTQKNELSTQYERTRKNLQMQSALSGLSSGANAQMLTSQSQVYLAQMQAIATAQANAAAEIEQSLLDLETEYKGEVRSAVENGDYLNAQAKLTAWQEGKTQLESRAQILAQYGDFSGYASLYDEATANTMQQAWCAQNPLMAYAYGYITKDQYNYLTSGKANNLKTYFSGESTGNTTSYIPKNDDNSDKTDSTSATLTKNADGTYSAGGNTYTMNSDGTYTLVK